MTNNSNNRNLVTYMLSRKDVDESELMGAILDLLMTGIDTTAILSCMLIYHISNNEKVQEQLYNEINKVNSHAVESLTANEINQMDYLRACIKETLRLTPVADLIERILETGVVLSGYRIPLGTEIVMHHRVMAKTCFENPDNFIPERWLRGSKMSKVVPFSYIPFGHGKRVCPGSRVAQMEASVIVVRILEKYKIINIGHPNIDMISGISNAPAHPIQIKFQERVQQN